MAPTAGALAPRVVAGALSASLIGLFVLPIVALVVYAGPGGLLGAATNGGFRTALEFTLVASGIAVALGLLTGVPLGYVLARYRFPGRSIVESLVTVPVVIPHLVVGIALLLLFSPTGALGSFAAHLGFRVFDATAGVVLVMLYVGASYVVLTSQIAFRAVDEEVLESARSLGARPSEAFLSVTLPAAARGIITGALLMWARGVSEIGGFLILAYAVYPGSVWTGPVTNTASVWIYNYYSIDASSAVAAAAFLVLVALVLFVAIRLFDRSGIVASLKGWLS